MVRATTSNRARASTQPTSVLVRISSSWRSRRRECRDTSPARCSTWHEIDEVRHALAGNHWSPLDNPLFARSRQRGSRRSLDDRVDAERRYSATERLPVRHDIHVAGDWRTGGTGCSASVAAGPRGPGHGATIDGAMAISMVLLPQSLLERFLTAVAVRARSLRAERARAAKAPGEYAARGGASELVLNRVCSITQLRSTGRLADMR